MKKFGGNWTEKKIDILVDYTKAYLTIMNKHPYWKLIYFDGFAGSGLIKKELGENIKVIYGAAKRVLEIDHPRAFDIYYFVEKDNNTYYELIQNTKVEYPVKNIYPVQEDCNTKLYHMVDFLNSEEGKNHKVLAYIDPFGMQLDWNSIKYLKETSVDLWVLVPTGLGVNRLLKKDGNISDSWYKRLEKFLGLSRKEIDNHFYQEKSTITLFGEHSYVQKESNAIEKAGELYSKRLSKVFNYVSNPFELKNSQNTTMFHYFMASNNSSAVKIANDIINKYRN